MLGNWCASMELIDTNGMYRTMNTTVDLNKRIQIEDVLLCSSEPPLVMSSKMIDHSKAVKLETYNSFNQHR